MERFCQSLRYRVFTLGIAVLGLVGCGDSPTYDGPKRFPLSGRVTFNGEPVANGMISFVPEDGKSNPAGGPVEAGTFTIPEEKGANPGPYRVLVYWHKPTGKQIQDPDTGETVDEVRQVIPPEFNGNTSLSVNVTDNPEQNTFEFDLESM